MNLTERFVQGVKAENDKRTDYPDDKRKGLVLRVTPSGSKSWSLRYRRKSDAKRCRVTLGDYPTFSLSDARAKANEIMVAVARGEDPAKDARRPVASAPRTFGELAERYMEGHGKYKRSWREDEKMLNRDLLPAFDGDPLSAIHRADVSAMIDAIVMRGSPIRANRTFALVRKIFNFAIEKGYLESTPVFRMKMPAPAKSRDRILSADEMRIFWRLVTDKTRMEWQMRTLLKLCLVTGQRIGEVAGTERAELKFDRAEWHIPEPRLKNKLPVHIVPLSPLAITLFKRALRRSKSDRFVLPSRMTGKQMVNTAPAQSVKKNLDVFGFDHPFTPHDLRRTLGSGLGELGYSRLVQDKVLNHVAGDRSVSAVYDRYEYMREKREALEVWADHLQSIIFDKPRALIVSASSVSRSRKASSPWAVV